MKIIYIEKKAHKIHKEFADSVGIKEFSYYLLPIFDIKYIRNNGILNQLFSLFSIFFIPKADIYLVDAINKSFPLVIKKIFNKNIKIISLNANSFFRDYNIDNNLIKKYKKFLCKYIDGVISVTNEVDSFIKNIDKNLSSKVVYPFIEETRFKGLNFSYTKKQILTIGGPSKVKGTDMLIDAFIEFNKKYIDYKLVIVGNGEWYNNFKEKYKNYNNIEFPGYKRNLAEYIMNSSIYIQPSRSEASGTAILEMMYCGTLPLVSKNVGFKELVNSVENDFIFDLNKKTIISLFKKIAEKKYDLKSLGQKSIGIAKKYTKNNQKEKFKNAFNELIR